MTPLGAFLTLVFAGAVVTLSRPAAAIAVIGAVCYITQGQVLQLGFSFTAVRIVLACGSSASAIPRRAEGRSV